MRTADYIRQQIQESRWHQADPAGYGLCHRGIDSTPMPQPEAITGKTANATTTAAANNQQRRDFKTIRDSQKTA
jgi:hypothetical protein